MGDARSAARFLDLGDGGGLDLKLQANAVLDLRPEFQKVTLVDLRGMELAKVAREHTYLAGEMEAFPDFDLLGAVLAGHTVRRPVAVLGPGAAHAGPGRAHHGRGRPGSGACCTCPVNVVRMWDLVSRRSVGDGLEAYIVDGHGRVIAAGDVATVLRGAEVAGMEGVGELLADQGGFKVYEGLHGRQVLGVAAGVPATGWTVVVETPMAAAFGGPARPADGLPGRHLHHRGHGLRLRSGVQPRQAPGTRAHPAPGSRARGPGRAGTAACPRRAGASWPTCPGPSTRWWRPCAGPRCRAIS